MISHGNTHADDDHCDECVALGRTDSSPNARRFAFLANHWDSSIDGMRLHEWLEANMFELGGLTAAVDAAMARAGKLA